MQLWSWSTRPTQTATYSLTSCDWCWQSRHMVFSADSTPPGAWTTWNTRLSTSVSLARCFMRKLSAKAIFKLSLLASLGYTALWLTVALPDMLHGGERLVVALLVLSGVVVLAFVGTLGLGFLFLYKRSDTI